MNVKLVLLDAHLSPRLCPWIESTFRVRSQHVREVGLRDSDDGSIIEYARRTESAILSKDGGLSERVEVSGPPPWVFLLTCGNASNQRLRAVLERQLPGALAIAGPETPAVILLGE